MRTARTTRAVALIATLAGLATPGLASGQVASADAPGCAPGGAGKVAVVVVIDFGELAAGSLPTPACVVVPDGSTGIDVLDERARLLGTPAPRYDPSGLLCAIDGLPEEGCGDREGARYLYWSYWQGSAEGWTFADLGPGSLPAASDRAEGWHFVRGAALPSDPPPRVEPFDVPAIVAGTEIARERPTGGRADEGSTGLAGIGAAAILGVALVGGGVWVARRRTHTADESQ